MMPRRLTAKTTALRRPPTCQNSRLTGTEMMKAAEMTAAEMMTVGEMTAAETTAAGDDGGGDDGGGDDDGGGAGDDEDDRDGEGDAVGDLPETGDVDPDGRGGADADALGGAAPAADRLTNAAADGSCSVDGALPPERPEGCAKPCDDAGAAPDETEGAGSATGCEPAAATTAPACGSACPPLPGKTATVRMRMTATTAASTAPVSNTGRSDRDPPRRERSPASTAPVTGARAGRCRCRYRYRYR